MKGNATVLECAGKKIRRGQTTELQLEISESYSGLPLFLPFKVLRAAKPGPALFVTAAIHGDELNGTGIVRELILDPRLILKKGTLVLVPVVNMLGFERHMRYLPDRRDLNRSFPGTASGSLAGRFAHMVFTEILTRCDYGIDLHSAAIRRTNFANVRGDLSNTGVNDMALAFGCELIVNSKGPKGSLRKACVQAGVPTMILEAGEIWKIEPAVVECGVQGILNVLIKLGMIDGQRVEPAYQACIDKTRWIRANHGGLLQFHVSPGDIVHKNQPLATNRDLMGREQSVIASPLSGIILGMTTLPSVKPGDPVCHLAIPRKGIDPIYAALEQRQSDRIHEKLRGDLATSIRIANEKS